MRLGHGIVVVCIAGGAMLATTSACSLLSAGEGQAGGGGGSSPVNVGGASGCVASACPGEDSTCTYRDCVEDSCAMVNAPIDTICTENDGAVCDGDANCVGCNRHAHCATGEQCEAQQCIALPCLNGVKDGSETDVDCGGQACSDCALGKSCLKFNDCESRLCKSGVCSVCIASSNCVVSDYCDSSEGNCTVKRSNGQTCTAAEQCGSSRCSDGYCCNSTCSGTCEACNGSGSEGSCSPYADGSDPESECGADSCSGGSSCRCGDNKLSGAETDVDCGGGTCPGCAAGDDCTVGTDCVSQTCDVDMTCT